MGCVIYFVLTKGCHPFGSYIERQANIAAGDYNLAQLCGPDKYVAADLIKKMISNNCNLRPSSGEVLSHCFYWKESKQLNFFLDVSDRVEKEVNSSPLVQRLESNADRVVGKDWRNQITEDLRTDLKRFRSYHGHSVTDLLRALRNKKHHYRELPQNLKDSIGEIPNGFVLYFTSRFPRLLIHVYNRMETFKNEDIFRQYY
jgi:serine/threonine protein kinase